MGEWPLQAGLKIDRDIEKGCGYQYSMDNCSDVPADACPISEKPNRHCGFNRHECFVDNESCYTREANDEGHEDTSRGPGESYASLC